jgi:hypothetical protein
MNDVMYHIYAKDVCLYSGLDKEEFEKTWSNVRGMVGLMKTEYTIDDLSYEELNYSRTAILDSSH